MKTLFVSFLLFAGITANAQKFDAKNMIDIMKFTYPSAKLWVEENGYIFRTHDTKDGVHSYHFNKDTPSAKGYDNGNVEMVNIQVKNDTINSILYTTLKEDQYDFILDGFRALQYKRDKELGYFTTYISDWYPKFNAVSMLDSGTRTDGSKYVIFATGIMRK